MRDIIDSKNFWYFLVGSVFVLFILVLGWRLIFASNKKTSTRDSYLAEATATPVPSASPTPRPSKLPLQLIKLNSSSNNNSQASKSSEVKVISREDGTTYLSTETNSQDSYDVAKSRDANRVVTLFGQTFVLPDGFFKDPEVLFDSLLKAVIIVAALLTLYNLVMGGIYWITSGGDKAKIESARNRIIHAVIGMIVLASSYAIFMLTLSFLGISSINDLYHKVNKSAAQSTTKTSQLQASQSAKIELPSQKTKGGL